MKNIEYFGIEYKWWYWIKVGRLVSDRSLKVYNIMVGILFYMEYMLIKVSYYWKKDLWENLVKYGWIFVVIIMFSVCGLIIFEFI